MAEGRKDAVIYCYVSSSKSSQFSIPGPRSIPEQYFKHCNSSFEHPSSHHNAQDHQTPPPSLLRNTI